MFHGVIQKIKVAQFFETLCNMYKVITVISKLFIMLFE